MISATALRRTCLRRTVIGCAAAGALLGMPCVAAAKVFHASFDDPQGDSVDDGPDVVAGRVAYNRKTGALSATVELADDGSAGFDGDFAIGVAITDLVKGKCQHIKFGVARMPDDPAASIGFVRTGDRQVQYSGRVHVDGNTMKLRVRAKGLAGHTPGCAYVLVGANAVDPSTGKPGEDYGQIVDQTARNNGFA